ncbi:hypothetical protein [Microbacterium sp. R86528]|uniref:hypothetical protein n=1 Tax=Microbacterium sp. R86528 TaxID=3093864 RepID=UPI0037CA3C36
MTDAELDLPDDLPEWGLTGLGTLGILWIVAPSIRALGRNLGKWTDYHTTNLLRLSEKVERRLEQAPEDAVKGDVHPRVAKEVIDAAAWIDDDIHQEYLAALLVAARSPEGGDDSAMYDVGLLKSLPKSAVRLHYAIYNSYWGTVPSLGERKGRTFLRVDGLSRLTLAAPIKSYSSVCGGGLGGIDRATDVLYRERLIQDKGPDGQGGYQVVPSSLGASLFVRAFVGGNLNTDLLLVPQPSLTSRSLSFSAPPDQPTLSGARVASLRLPPAIT